MIFFFIPVWFFFSYRYKIPVLYFSYVRHLKKLGFNSRFLLFVRVFVTKKNFRFFSLAVLEKNIIFRFVWVIFRGASIKMCCFVRRATDLRVFKKSEKFCPERRKIFFLGRNFDILHHEKDLEKLILGQHVH